MVLYLAKYMGSSLIRVPFKVLFITVPYYIGDLNRVPILENYPHEYCLIGPIKLQPEWNKPPLAQDQKLLMQTECG